MNKQNFRAETEFFVRRKICYKITLTKENSCQFWKFKNIKIIQCGSKKFYIYVQQI